MQTTNSAGKPSGDIVISYRGDTPLITNAWGQLPINCQISDNGFADAPNNGKAQGMGRTLVTTLAGDIEVHWRDVLTFSDNNGL
jgi:hypothetical protein